MILTNLQLKVSATFSTKMTKDFNQLMSQKAPDAPLCLAAFWKCYCNLQEYDDSEKTAKIATTTLTLLSSNLKLRRALIIKELTRKMV